MTHLILGIGYGLVHILIGSFFVANGLYFDACAMHFRSILISTSDISEGNRTILMKNAIIDAIDFHNEIKRCEVSRLWYSRIGPHFSEPFQNFRTVP